MLACQTADENLFVPDLDIASLTPVHPNRTRVVLADGTVAHRPGPPPPGPWVKLHDSWVTPHHLVREGDYWKDPGNYLYPYEPLAEIEVEEEETDLPEGLIAFEVHDHVYFWRTDTGLVECDLKPAQAQQLYPQLCLIGKSHMVNMRRVRRYGRDESPRRCWFVLDNGERLVFSPARLADAYQALGVESLVVIERGQKAVLNRLRDFSYDLTNADPERIRRDCPTLRSLLYNLIWQTVLYNLQGVANDYGRDTASYALNPVVPALKRCGYELPPREPGNAFAQLVHADGVLDFVQVRFVEKDPTRRRVGESRPEVLLIAPHTKAKAVRSAAEKWQTSLLISKSYDDRLPLEILVPQLPSGLHVFFHKINKPNQEKVLRILEFLDATVLGPPVQLESLDDIEDALKSLPVPYVPPAPEPFRRIPLQANETGLLLADPEEIAAWSPTRFSRWRVVLADGQVLHHPGPVPPGPWVPLGEHWVQPHLIHHGKDPAGFTLPDLPMPPAPLAPPRPKIQADPALPCPPERVLCLQDSPGGAYWLLDDGRKLPAGMSAELAAPHHPGLLRFSKSCWVHHNRIRLTGKLAIQLDGQVELPLTVSLIAHQLRLALGLPALDRLAPDHHNLDCMKIRDFPFEIARASAAVLRQHFPTALALIANVLYQSFDMYEKSGAVPYGDGFSEYFYRPLQAILYRAGFLTRAQFRAPMRALSAKQRYYFLFARTIYNMVYHHKLFTYCQFGFVDPFPEDRILGKRRPHQILLVEKGDVLETFGRQMQEQFELSLLILKGTPSLLATEYFAAALKKAGILEVEVYFYGDYDYAGWDIGLSFIRQLKSYGIRCTLLRRLVLPECFTPEELAVFSRPLDIPNASVAGRVKSWLSQGGGINGEARGIHANWLFPYQRLSSRLESLIQ